MKKKRFHSYSKYKVMVSVVRKEITPKLNLISSSARLTMLNKNNYYKFKIKDKCH